MNRMCVHTVPAGNRSEAKKNSAMSLNRPNAIFPCEPGHISGSTNPTKSRGMAILQTHVRKQGIVSIR